MLPYKFFISLRIKDKMILTVSQSETQKFVEVSLVLLYTIQKRKMVCFNKV